MSKRTEQNLGYKSEFHRNFIKAFKCLTERHGRFDVWSDFVIMSACAISNACDRRFFKEREEEYLKCVKKYSKKELELFPEMFSQLVLALDRHSEQDFLGEIFGALNLHNEWHGQFFTPYHIGEFMAKLNLTNLPEEVKDKDVITVSDPCCGAGCLLIACANEAHKMNVNYQEKLMFFAQDIDRIAALMCYIQLSVLGCKAVVKIGNSLTEPLTADEPMNANIWLTPMLTCGKMFHIISQMSEIREEEHNDGEEKVSKNPDKTSSNLEGEIPA